MSGRQKSNFVNPDINPCLEESELSQKCLEEKFYNYTECSVYFENYKNCKRFWGQISLRRKLDGITPVLPGKEERDEILRLRKEGKKVHSTKTSV